MTEDRLTDEEYEKAMESLSKIWEHAPKVYFVNQIYESGDRQAIDEFHKKIVKCTDGNEHDWVDARTDEERYYRCFRRERCSKCGMEVIVDSSD